MIWQLVSTLLGIQTTILHPGHHIHCKVCPYKWSSRGCRDTVRDWTHTCTSVDTTHVRQWTQHMYVSGHNTCMSVDTTHVRQWTQHMYVSGHNTCMSVDTTHVRQRTQHMYVSGHTFVHHLNLTQQLLMPSSVCTALSDQRAAMFSLGHFL